MVITLGGITMLNPINTQLPIFCPRPDCDHYMLENNTITKDGAYTTINDPIPRQMYYCHGGKHRFSETGYSELFGKHGSFKEYEQTAILSSTGNSTKTIAETLKKDPRTIDGWQKAIGAKCHQFHMFLCLSVGLTILFFLLDEFWSYVKNKGRQAWGFIALEANTKFWIAFELGSRTTNTAKRLVNMVKQLGIWAPEL